jgi:hypothetical protein
MSILSARLLLAGALAVGAGACTAAPVAVRGTFEADGLPSVNVVIAIQSEHAGDADRYRHAAFTTLKILGNWLGPFPDAALSADMARTRWWSAPATMVPEFAVARVVSRRYWERVIDTRALPPWFVSGLSEYSARRAVSKIVDERYLAVYRSSAEGRYFGGFVPRDLRVQLRAEDEGDPVGDYRASPRAATAGVLEAKTLLTLGTLERWTGRPVFDAILEEFVHAASSQASWGSSSQGAPTLDDFVRVATRVSGQDLSWLFDQTLKGSGVFDYGIAKVDSHLQADGWYRTTVDVHRLGDGVFSGATAAADGADGPFERGRGIAVLTTFADGESVRDTWDGRSLGKTFEYRSRSRARSAEVDPDRVLLLDLNRSNNGVALETTAARSAAGRWAARWMLWMEDALLTYVSFT